MKNSFFALLLVCFSFLSYSQESVAFDNLGTYELLPNAKVTYPFNKVIVMSEQLDLYMDNQHIQTLSLLGMDEKLRYKVIQTYPELAAEKKQYAEMNITYVLNENGILQVQVHGTKVSEEHFLKKID